MKEQAMYVRLPKELHEQIKKRAEEEDRTMSQLIRVALRGYLNGPKIIIADEDNVDDIRKLVAAYQKPSTINNYSITTRAEVE